MDAVTLGYLRDALERAELELRARAMSLDTEHLRAVQRRYLRERAERRRGDQG